MNSGNVFELMTSANRAHAACRFGECQALCQKVLLVEPRNVAALVLAGVAAFKMGDSKAAVPFFENAVAVEPRCAPAYLWLSMAHRNLGQKTQALSRAREAVSRNPNDALTLHHIGLCHLDVEDFRSAEASFMKALSIAPNVATVHYGLGLAFQGLKRTPDAISAFRRSARLDPTSVPSQIALRQLLMDDGDFAGAAKAAREVVRLQPESAEANLWLSLALVEGNQPAEAEIFLEKGLAMAPDSPVVHTLIGSALQVKGNLTDAIEHFRRSIELHPEQGAAYRALVANWKLTEMDRPLLEKMSIQAANADLLPSEQSELHFAMGKAYEDLREYRNSMEHFDEANRISYQIKFGSRKYDSKALDEWLQRALTFGDEVQKSDRVHTRSAPMPIFVIGMIRSGTTLVEQVLSCHPDVGAAGELSFWLENCRAVATRGGKIDYSMLARLAAKYEVLLNAIAPGKSRVVDKMPMNYHIAGLLHLAYPEAKIIHIVRNPLDTCLSIYTTPNRNRMEWAHSKGNIVLAYQNYLRLITYWREVLPSNTMLDIHYEDLVSTPEPTIRALVEFCGLEWNPACLRPDLNQRSVITPSTWQVRQPIYRSSVERWRNFEPWLGEFAKLMSD